MYEVVWPRGKGTSGVVRFGKRLDTLAGKTIGELWNWVYRGDEIFPMIEKELSKRYPGIKFVSYRDFEPTHGPDERRALRDIPDKLKQYQCDAVISGVGA